MAENPVNKTTFQRKAQLKHVKTRTPYLVVKQYERDFKRKFGKELGTLSVEFLDKASKFLNE